MSDDSKGIEILAPPSFESTQVQFWCSHKRFTIDKPSIASALATFTAGSVYVLEHHSYRLLLFLSVCY